VAWNGDAVLRVRVRWRGSLLPLALTLVLLTTACSGSGGDPPPSSDGPSVSSAGSTAPAAPIAPYAEAVKQADALGMKVWLDADLAARWLAGPESFRVGVRRLGRLSELPGVVGIRIADELGYEDGFANDFDRIMSFLRDSASALHEAAPGKLILIDLVVPQLGCAPDLPAVADRSGSCMADAASRYPDLTLERVDTMLASNTVDVVDLSTYLASEDTYRAWGITIDEAQTAAWEEVGRRGWTADATLRARKALAFPGAYPGDATQAARDLHTYVDIPMSLGATGVDIWTWRQEYDGQLYHLLDPGPQPDPLWRGLVGLHRNGAVLSTHFSPSYVQQSVAADLATISTAFTDVFVAAGIG
jgi:hypothetical protein